MDFRKRKKVVLVSPDSFYFITHYHLCIVVVICIIILCVCVDFSGVGRLCDDNHIRFGFGSRS